MQKKLTNEKRLEALAQFELPPDLQTKLQGVRDAITALKGEAKVWRVEKEFSPDGRFLGDLGELIAKIFFGVTLNIKQEKGHDAKEAEVDGEATAHGGRKVEVKLRSRSTNIHFTEKTEIILVIYVSPTTLKWGVVCNGPGGKLLAGSKLMENGKYSTSCYKLMDAQLQVVQSDPQLKQIVPKKPI